MTDNLGILKERLNLEILNTREEEMHFHQNIELLFVLEGEMDVTVNDQKTHLPSEGIIVVNSNRRHELKAGPDILYMKLTIQWQMVSDVIQSSDILFWCNSTFGEDARYTALRDLLKKLLGNYLSTGGNVVGFRHISLCYQIMDTLAANFFVSRSDHTEIPEKVTADERISQINSYLRANYTAPISLTELADSLHLSTGYLSRFFKKHYGTNFSSYLEDLRLHYATEELLYTDKNITRIVFDNGFPGVAAFDRAFRLKNSITPTEFRKRRKPAVKAGRKRENSKEIEQRLEKYLSGAAPAEKIDDSNKIEVTLDAAKEGIILRSTRTDTINIGSAGDLLRSEIREHLILLREQLGFRYVRLWNIFSEGMLLDQPGSDGEYNFSRLDSVLDFLLENHLLPHLELGNKPRRIMKNIQKPLLSESAAQTPAGLTDIGAIKAMIRHLNRQYGGQIDNWRFEIWYPEKRRDFLEDQKQYIDYFGKVYDLIHERSDTAFVGGCGIRLIGDRAETERFLRMWSERGTRPDFLSAIYYSYDVGSDSGDNFARRSTDPDHMLHMVQKFQKMTENCGFGGVSLFLSEWNLTISDRNWMNDTCCKGAWIVKNMIAVYGMVQGIAYFHGTDRLAEFYDSNQLLSGGSGLLTRDSIPKPALFAFQMINMLHPRIVQKGENYVVTRDKNGSYAILCHNLKPFGNQYYLTPENELEKDNLWKYFDDHAGKELTFKFSQLEDGIYKTRILRMNPDHGNILKLWKDTAFETDFSREDRNLLKNASSPMLNIRKDEAVSGELALCLKLEANEFAYLEMQKE